MPYVLDIVVLFEMFEKLLHVLDLILVGESDIVRGHLLRFGGKERVSLLLEDLAYLAQVVGIGIYLVYLFLNGIVNDSVTITPFLVNSQLTEPVWPRFPPYLSK